MSTRAKDEGDVPATRTCATDIVHERLLREVPEYAERRAASENDAWLAARTAPVARTGCTRIPVVVHVVQRVASEDISKAQIDSQIAVLNADYRKKNADVALTPAVFMPFTADARIEFALATTDPDGNPTDGVTRTKTTVNGFTHDDAVKSAATGGADAWPADRYLNVWVCRLTGGLLGYAQFPGGPAATDGVVILSTAFGTTGTATAPFDLGRTATHEIGHWLNLRHIGGDDGSGCNGSDFVADTPNQASQNTGRPTFPHVTCGNGPNGDMFMNYMDYVDDVAMFMFTAGQVTRMQAALDGARSSVGTSIPCAKLKFTDEPVTLKFRDDPVGTLKFRDDPIGTVKFRDDQITTTKALDDPITTKNADDVVTTSKRIDDVKFGFLDKPPTDDVVTTLAAADVVMPGDPLGPVVNPQIPQIPGLGAVAGLGRAGAAPFVLATPHHSQVWAGEAASMLDDYERVLDDYEKALKEAAAAETRGELAEDDVQAARVLYEEYVRLADEYRRLGGGA